MDSNTSMPTNTKESIFLKHSAGKSYYAIEDIYSAMEEYAQQEISNLQKQHEDGLLLYKNMTDNIARLQQENERLKEALELSVRIIKGWHNMADSGMRLSKEQVDQMWQIYYEKSPEMKLIRNALSATPVEQDDQNKLWKELEFLFSIQSESDKSHRNKYHITKL